MRTENTVRDAAIEAAIDEHQKQERPRLREYLQTQYVLHDLNRIVFKAGNSRVERDLQDHGADRDLQRLVEKGCDGDHIIALLTLLDSEQVPPRWLGFKNREELKTAVNLLRDGEQIIRRVQDQTKLFRHLSSQWIWLGMFPLLPELIERYCSLVDLFANSDEGRSDPVRELLVAHVVERTGSPCDKEIASLIAALPRHGGYSIDAHRKWRRRKGFVGDQVPFSAEGLSL